MCLDFITTDDEPRQHQLPAVDRCDWCGASSRVVTTCSCGLGLCARHHGECPECGPRLLIDNYEDTAMKVKLDDKVIEALARKRDRLLARQERRGGRSVALADEIDRLTVAIEALKGELHCPLCVARLTCGR